MDCDSGACEHGWHYADPRTTAGALQRGLGRGAGRALDDPAGPSLVIDCLRRDYRWDWQVDERAVYLARLVRDLHMPVETVLQVWLAAPDQDADDDNVFDSVLDVLEVLGRGGDDQVVQALREQVRHGERWAEVLAVIARGWPIEWWTDLRSAVTSHRDALTVAAHWRCSPPWTTWAAHDEQIAAAIADATTRGRPSRPYADQPTAQLLDILRDPDHTEAWRNVLRELRRRPPEPALLDMLDPLLAAGLAGPLLSILGDLGPVALPAARRWVSEPHHLLAWAGYRLLAAHGDTTDAERVVAGLDWLDNRPDDLCGYDELAGGLARIGGPVAMAALPRIRRLWFSPHSYERAHYLRAHLTLDPDGARPRLAEGLWDCEADVRLLATQHVHLDNNTRIRLRHLCDDPMETTEVRAAATQRLD